MIMTMMLCEHSLLYLIIRFIGQEYASSDSWSTPHSDSEQLAADPPLPECELGYSYNASTSALPPALKESPTVLVTTFHNFNLPPFQKTGYAKRLLELPP